MSERWKYQIKMGGFWGIFMIIFMTLFEIKEKPLMEQLSSTNFYIRAGIYLAVGIFGLGYYNWKQKMKSENSEKR
jgi:hypothetical protein